MQVLLIHADPVFATDLGDALERFGATVDYAVTGRLGMQMATVRTFDAIVLAAELPGTEGLQVCRTLREMGMLTPVMMVGVQAGLERTIAALEAGADDYRAPPVAFVEIHARLRALCRRPTSVLKIGDLQFDPVPGVVQRQGKQLHLTPLRLKLLRVLMEAAPRLVSRMELEACLWGRNNTRMAETNLRQQVHGLRAVIDKPFDTPLIRTYHGVGYRLAPPHWRPPEIGAEGRASTVAVALG